MGRKVTGQLVNIILCRTLEKACRLSQRGSRDFIKNNLLSLLDGKDESSSSAVEKEKKKEKIICPILFVNKIVCATFPPELNRI